MGTLFRLLVFMLTLATLGTGTAWLLARERQREAMREQLIIAPLDSDPKAILASLRTHQKAADQDLVLFGVLAVSCVFIMAVLPARVAAPFVRASLDDSPDPTHREMIGLEHLARATVAQRAELDQERESRHRSEQDLYLQQVLANHALQGKIRLGRDLHDGLVQSLYATGLMLESATQQLDSDPAQAAKTLASVKSNLKASIRDTRAVIGGLTPDELENRNLAESINALLDHLDGGRLEERKVTLSPDLPVLPETVTTELLQIIRESVSNALRHGPASRLTIHCAPDGDLLRLSIRDNGAGFDSATVRHGHGLDNLSARARLLGGHLHIDSRPGEGTCVNLSLPLPSTA